MYQQTKFFIPDMVEFSNRVKAPECEEELIKFIEEKFIKTIFEKLYDVKAKAYYELDAEIQKSGGGAEGSMIVRVQHDVGLKRLPIEEFKKKHSVAEEWNAYISEKTERAQNPTISQEYASLLSETILAHSEPVKEEDIIKYLISEASLDHQYQKKHLQNKMINESFSQNIINFLKKIKEGTITYNQAYKLAAKTPSEKHDFQRFPCVYFDGLKMYFNKALEITKQKDNYDVTNILYKNKEATCKVNKIFSDLYSFLHVFCKDLGEDL